MSRLTPALFALLVTLLSMRAAGQSSQPKAVARSAVQPVDKAYLQSIWDGWASNDLEKQGRFYAQGPDHLFFDVAPLKYTGWEQYKAGVAPSLKDAPKVTFTLNNDMQIHPEGKITWVAGTLNMQAPLPQGPPQTLTLRWTAVFEREAGRWLIVHEHVSAPAEPPRQ